MSMIWSGCSVGLSPPPVGLLCGCAGWFCSWFVAVAAVASSSIVIHMLGCRSFDLVVFALSKSWGCHAFRLL
eukprot:7767586-Prorocentrum_lima.AAC.1